MNARLELVAIFSDRIHQEIRIKDLEERSANAILEDRTLFDGIITRQVGMDALIGVEIYDRWADCRGTFFALAVMNKARAIQVYNERLRTNQRIINDLIAMPIVERNTLSGFSRYRQAAEIADTNIGYWAVLSVLDAPPVPGLKVGYIFRLEAQEIASRIPISINVRNDRGGRIHSAFSRTFSEEGLRISGVNPRYALDVDIAFHSDGRPSPLSGMVFADMALSANLVDTSTRAVLLHYSFNLSEAAGNQRDAENLAAFRAEQRINNEYRENYLSSLIPRR
jgi:hypothetical protein